jgi:hypothetical protein
MLDLIASKYILLAEDNPANLHLVHEALEVLLPDLRASEHFRKPSGWDEFMALGPKARRILEGVPS